MNRHAHPEIYQKKWYQKRYFEGWYYKQISADGKDTLSLIPSVSFTNRGTRAFLQAIHLQDNTLSTALAKYPIDHFSASDEPFTIKLSTCEFSLSSLQIDYQTDDLSINGALNFEGITPLEYSILQPNIMGYFSYISNLECNHAVISMTHQLSGILTINNRKVDFTGGKGYIEKDWGRSFPSRYIWIQSNHFSDHTSSLFFSHATIPFVGGAFDGFICNLLYAGKQYRFATYNHSKITIHKRTEQIVHTTLSNSKLTLEIFAKIDQSQALKAPLNGEMDHIIKEALSGEVSISLKSTDDNIIYQDQSSRCGIEIVNELAKG